MKYKVKILHIESLTYDTNIFRVEKPSNFSFVPGHSIMLYLDEEKAREEKRAFSFTSTNKDNYLEFIIKKYSNSLAEKLHSLKVGDSLFLSDMFGSIRYSGKGVFIAGGAGITPFIAIFRQLKKDNALPGNLLIYSNKESKDIILEEELKSMLKDNCIFTLTRERKEGYENSKIDESFLKDKISNFQQEFYICGSWTFINDIKNILNRLKVGSSLIAIEKKLIYLKN